MSYPRQRRSSIRTFCLLFVFAQALAVPTAQNATTRADRVVVLKKEHRLELWHNGTAFRTYQVALGTVPVGHKQRQGDHKTPEGFYKLDRRNPHSQFYKAIHISYPNESDRAAARKLGISPGGDVFIHGLAKKFAWVGKSHRLRDWTDGCIAVTNEEMDEIWELVPDGVPIEIKP